MASSQEIEMMIKAACSGGLSRDAIHSLGSLASKSAEPRRRLEDILEELDPKDREGLDRLRKVKESMQNSAYLD